MSIELKIKAKTLAAEAIIIRLEKRKAKARRKTKLVEKLTEHSRTIVRKEARSTHLARGFLSGTEYTQIERKTKFHKPGPDWNSVERMIRSYGDGDVRDRMQCFSEWKAA